MRSLFESGLRYTAAVALALYAYVVFGLVLPDLAERYLTRMPSGVEHNAWQYFSVWHGTFWMWLIVLVLGVVLAKRSPRFFWGVLFVLFLGLHIIAIWAAYRVTVGRVLPLPPHT